MVRNGAVKFIKNLSRFYNIYFFSYLNGEIIRKVVDEIFDLERTIFLRKDPRQGHLCQIRQYIYNPYSQDSILKNPMDMLTLEEY